MARSRDLTPEAEIARDCLATRLRLLNRRVTNIYDDALRPLGIRVSQMNILVAIAAAGPLRAVDVASHLHLDASTLSRDLERLLELSWIEVISGESRKRLLQATPRGREMIAKALPRWREAQRRARQVLSPSAAAAITRAVESLQQTENPE